MSDLTKDANVNKSKKMSGIRATIDSSRRDFVREATIAVGTTIGILGLGTAGTAGQTVIKGDGTRRSLPVLQTVPKGVNSDILIRMQMEVREAMAKPIAERRWMMVIDTRKCVGCHACTIACVAENKLPPGVVYRPVGEKTTGTFPNLKTMFLPQPCMQCDKPPCVPVCPADATWKRPDGIVAIDYDKCIGCGLCVPACPYNHRSLDEGGNYTDKTPKLQPYEQQPNFEYGKSWNRKNGGTPVGKARKCHFCLHRLEEGQLPQCVSTCIGRATYFGDGNNPKHLVSEMAAKPNATRLLEEKGTRPTVVYLV